MVVYKENHKYALMALKKDLNMEFLATFSTNDRINML